MTVSVVCLDAADTLFTERTSRAELYVETLSNHGVTVDRETMAVWMGEAHDALPPRIDGQPRYSDAWFRSFVAYLLKRAGSSGDAEGIRAELADVFTSAGNYVVFGDTFPALDDLLESGYRLAIVSNWSPRLEGLMHDLGLLHYFEILAVSAVVGVDKPDPSLFHYALQRLDANPAEAVHVGDHLQNDVAGAQAAGLRAFHLDRETVGGPESLSSLLELRERIADA